MRVGKLIALAVPIVVVACSLSRERNSALVGRWHEAGCDHGLLFMANGEGAIFQLSNPTSRGLIFYWWTTQDPSVVFVEVPDEEGNRLGARSSEFKMLLANGNRAETLVLQRELGYSTGTRLRRTGK